ncbi:riboflavin biosynthesis protein [Enterococcus florum]|uniref:Riboflavin biosynthesis protein n=1 Tax=Enterococcus florum TaxID=2480627 RepID=A0A4P5PH63_9ENTE|nr:riboflavin biosynthesis protein RibF [Enterococcus florum]GCF92763.1 riboflavin biosynthesis protein [Enterococcus florum]
MEIIKLHHPYHPSEIPAEEVVMVLGFFDGVHKGHQEVIQTGKRIAQKRELKLAVMTFNQHPAVVFQKVDQHPIHYLSNLNQKERLMEQLGVDYLYEVAFTSAFAAQSPQEFVDRYIVDLHGKVAVSGFDYTYGKGAEADVAHLPIYAKERFDVVTVPKQIDHDEKISSSRIRRLLNEGNMEEANHLLGYIYETNGIVIHGDARGRELGYPTANIQIENDMTLPKMGVYANKVLVNGEWYIGMGSIGRNDTFEPNRKITVEINLLDFDQNIYGEEVNVRWYSLLRDQVKFESAEKLIEQLKIDENNTRDYFLQH